MSLPVRISRWSSYIELAGKAFAVDPFIIAAVMDRESLGGEALTPKGAAGVGDKGHGRGLMQIDDRYHSSFIAAKAPDGTPLWTKPLWSVLYGAQILAHNFYIFDGDIAAAIAAYNAGARRVRTAITALGESEARLKTLDSLTAGGNYVTDVLERRREFSAQS